MTHEGVNALSNELHNAPEPALAGGRKRENWGSKIGVILAVAGSAVGLGNFLRFPGLAAKYGGGTFMIPYFISLLVIGIPICWCEWTLGRQGGKHGYHSSPGIFRIVTHMRGSHFLGVVGLLIPLVIYMYYVYIESWCLAYAWYYLRDGFANVKDVAGYGKFFEQFAGAGEDGLAGGRVGDFGRFDSIVFLVIAFAINFVLIFRGLTKGIESFCKIAMPVLILAAVVILIRVLTLGAPNPEHPERNVNAGLGFMWNPNIPVRYEWEQTGGIDVHLDDKQKAHPHPTFIAPNVNQPQRLVFDVTAKGGTLETDDARTVWVVPAGEQAPGAGQVVHPRQEVRLDVDVDKIKNQSIWAALSDPQIWLEAAGQIFFSLSVGFGIIITYASYLRPKDDIALSGLTASATNEFCEVCLGGLITVPAAFIFLGGDPIHEVAGSSLGLGFYTFPAIFDQMIGGRFWGFLWFFLLFLAAITSSLSMLQPAIAFIEEALGVGRRISVTLLMMVTAVGALLVVYLSKNLMALEMMNFWVGSVLIYIMATIIVIVFGWVIGAEKGLVEANRGSHLRIPEKFFGFMIKYVSPLYLLTIFAMFVGQNVPDYIATVAKSEAAQITLAFVGVLIVFLTILVYLASKRWKEQDRRLSNWEI